MQSFSRGKTNVQLASWYLYETLVVFNKKKKSKLKKRKPKSTFWWFKKKLKRIKMYINDKWFDYIFNYYKDNSSITDLLYCAG